MMKRTTLRAFANHSGGSAASGAWRGGAPQAAAIEAMRLTNPPPE
jgi:hypothetical protein